MYNGENPFFSEHYDRLKKSADHMGYQLHLDESELRTIIDQLCEKNEISNAYIRITITRGNASVGFGKSLTDNQTILIIAKLHQLQAQQNYDDGVKIAVAKTRRNAPESVDPQIKSISNLNSLLGKREAKEKDVFEVLMLNTKDVVTECSAANVFWVKDKEVFTPDVSTGILEGVTRKTVIEIIENEEKLTCKTGHFYVEDVLNANEVFITSTSLEVMPVTQIDDYTISDGKVGQVSQNVLHKFQARYQ